MRAAYKNWPLAIIFLVSSTNVHLVDINVFAKFYKIPSLPFQDIEKPKCRRRTNRGTNILGLCGQTCPYFMGLKVLCGCKAHKF